MTETRSFESHMLALEDALEGGRWEEVRRETRDIAGRGTLSERLELAWLLESHGYLSNAEEIADELYGQTIRTGRSRADVWSGILWLLADLAWGQQRFLDAASRYQELFESVGNQAALALTRAATSLARLDTDSRAARTAAIQALVTVGGTARARLAAGAVLHHLGDPRGTAALRDLEQDSDADVYASAARWLLLPDDQPFWYPPEVSHRTRAVLDLVTPDVIGPVEPTVAMAA